MTRLGEDLMRGGRLTGEALRRALDLQRQLGGRLGTNLLEIGALPEGVLLQTLGTLLATRTASAAQLAHIPSSVIRSIPAKLARRYQIVPFQRRGNTLFVAAMGAGDVLVEDEVRMLSGCLVRTHLALELRIQEALGRYYQAPIDVRVSALVRRLTGAEEGPGSPPPASLRRSAEVAAGPAPAVPTLVDSGSWSGPVAEVGPSRSPETPDRRAGSATPPAAGASTFPEPAELRQESPSSPLAAAPGVAARVAAGAVAPAVPEAKVPPARPADLEGGGYPELTYIEIGADEEAALRGTPVPPDSPRDGDQEDGIQEDGDQEAGAHQDNGPGANSIHLSRTVAAPPTRHLVIPPPDRAEDPAVLEGSVEERLARAADELQGAVIRDEIADAMLEFCAPYLSRRALLIHRSDRILGWRGEGPEVDETALRSLEISPRDPSVFLSLSHAAGFWLGPLPALPANRALLECLGGTPPKDCLVLPVALRSKIVCYLYGDNLGEGVATAPLADLKRLMGKTSLAFEVYILKNKIRLL